MLIAVSTPGVLELAVVIYRPREDNFHHWGFHVYSRNTQGHRIFQAEGPVNQLTAQIRCANPNSSARLLKGILLGGVYDTQFTRLAALIQGVEMQNDVSLWDCQEYVIDIMDALQEGGVLGSRAKYDAIKRAIKDMRGIVDLTYHAVVSYDYDRLVDDADEEEDDDDDDDNNEDEDENEDGHDNNGRAPKRRKYQSKEPVEDSDDE